MSSDDFSDPSRLTLLDAVNELLRATGRTKVASLGSADMDQAAEDALLVLRSSMAVVQAMEWNFNTEENLPVEPEVGTGRILLPENTAAIRAGSRSQAEYVAQRGGRLYDRLNRTDVFARTIYLDVRLLFDFEEIPPPIRWYIVCHAGRRYATGRVPDMSTYRFTKAAEDEAFAAAQSFDAWETARTAPEINPHFEMMRRR